MREMNIATMDEVYAQISKGGTVLSKYANLIFGYFAEDKRIEQRKEEEKQKALLANDAKKEKIRSLSKGKSGYHRKRGR